MRDPVKIISNPFSGGGRARGVAAAVIERLRARGCRVELAETEHAGDARTRAAETAGFAAVGCVGGDGTVNEVLNGLPEKAPPPLAAVPCGTANVLAKELGLPRDPEGLARMIAEGREIPWDLGVEHRSGRRFLLFASAGYDAHVVHLFHATRRKPLQIWSYALYNMWLYIVWGFKSIREYTVPQIRVDLDGRTLATDATWVQISNIRSYGGPLVFTPHAMPDDGAFEVMIQKAPRKRDVFRMFWAAILNFLFGVTYRMHDVTFHTARRVRLASANGSPVPIQVDGDPGGHTPADFEVLPGGVRILAP
ncbi:MAG TPA: diacylglycerol kinase family protein [Planctomycetota bacterium]|nr:diacylglycerol kinase family protein [Planctomycetota bacterium]